MFRPNFKTHSKWLGITAAVIASLVSACAPGAPRPVAPSAAEKPTAQAEATVAPAQPEAAKPVEIVVTWPMKQQIEVLDKLAAMYTEKHQTTRSRSKPWRPLPMRF